MIDRLLASPHYGERWGRFVARRRPLRRFQRLFDRRPREMWPYRDWVIDALNADMPFDRFTVEQLAGDLLPEATLAQKVATGFHRNTPINQEGGIDKEQFRVESVIDRVATTGTVWLGLTVGCAQCHDHKYDPISQKEYYQLFAFLNNSDEPTLPVATPEIVERREEVEARVAEYIAGIETDETLQAAQRDLGGWAVPRGNPEALAWRCATPTTSPSMTARPRPTGSSSPSSSTRPRTPRSRSTARRSRRSARSAPKIPTTLVVKERSQPRETHLLMGGDFTRPGDVVHARRAGRAAGPRDRRGRDARPARPGPLAGGPREPADGPRHGQPALAGVLRPGPGRDRRRLRNPGHPADPSRTARLAGRHVHGIAAGDSRRSTG